MMTKILQLLFFAGCIIVNAHAQSANSQTYWSFEQEQKVTITENVILRPSVYKIVRLDHHSLKALLRETKGGVVSTLSLPHPDGSFRMFNVYRNSLMPFGLQARYPDIMTFTATSADDDNIVARIDFTPRGFHAMVLDKETYFIDPYTKGEDGLYYVYYGKDYTRTDGNFMTCGNSDDKQIIAEGIPARLEASNSNTRSKTHGSTRKTYRLALSCTGEYAQAVDGPSPTKAGVLAAMTTTMNRVNGIYEKEVAITMEFIENMDTLIYLNSSTDPFTKNFDGDGLLDENQTNTDLVIGTDGYDIGHIFSTGGGGVAALGSVCAAWGGKAQGVTGSSSPVGDKYDVDYVAHEMGHQFGADHTFNRCSGTEAIASAYEPGSGSTIMAYAGICGANNIQSASSAYFHGRSLDEISDFLNSTSPWFGGATCGVATLGPTIVSLPSIAATYNIPASTPFELESTPATAGTSGTLTYAWEQWNLGNFRADEAGSATFLNGPTFRSYTPVETPWRVFPQIDSLIENKTSFRGERLPSVTRTLHFKLTAREVGSDGWGTFHLSEDNLEVNVRNTGQPFSVTNPSVSGISWKRGTTQTVNWVVAGTDAAPINTTTVDIYLSTDGGYTYPIELASGVPNIGSATVNVPEGLTTSTARIKVKGSGNIFFDISNNNFAIGDTTILSLNNSDLLNTISIYPNPAQDFLFIETNHENHLVAMLVNSIGQKVWIGTLHNSMHIQVGHFAKGMYFLIMRDEKTGASATKRITIN
jgi:hypothetical protein